MCADGEEHLAELLAEPLHDAGYTVSHSGTVLVGDSTVGEATKALAAGAPVVLCATPRAVGSQWAHQIVNAGRKTSNVFVVQMDADAYLDQLAIATRVARYCDSPSEAIVGLLAALAKNFPPVESNSSATSPSPDETAQIAYFDQSVATAILDTDALLDFRSRMRPEFVRQYPAALTGLEFLDRANLRTGDLLTRTGALLFARNPSAACPTTMIKCVCYLGTTRDSHRQDPKTYEGTVPTQIEAAHRYVERHVQGGEAPISTSPYTAPAYTYPMLAVREIVANALTHRDYNSHDSCVHLRLFSDRLEISSPGAWAGRPLSAGVVTDLSELEGQSIKRNFRLAHLLYWIKLVEGEGSGIPTAVSDCDRAHAPRPTVLEDQGFVTVTLRPSPSSLQESIEGSAASLIDTPSLLLQARSGQTYPPATPAASGKRAPSERVLATVQMGDPNATLARREAPVSQLPVPRRQPVGRADELDLIRKAVARASADDEPAWIWISGPPGIGKSTLAVAAGRALSDQFPDHQIMVDLNGSIPNAVPMSSTNALGALLTQLGVPDESIPATLEERSREYQRILTDSRALVVLDNAQSEQDVLSLLPDVAGCATLVTSRRVGDIDFVPVRLEPLSNNSARVLFDKLLGPSRLADRKRLDELVAWCGGIPLAICVVASVFHRHPGWTLEHLLQQLRDHSSRLPDSAFGTVGTAIAVTYQQLADPHRRMFRLLSTLPGPDVTSAAAAALADCPVAAARALLDELQAASMAEEPEPDRYRMLEPLKQYAAAIEPGSPQETSEAMDRLLDFQLVTAAAAMRAAFPFDVDRWPVVTRTSHVALSFNDDARAAKAWLAAERFNLSAAIRSADERGRVEHVWQLAVLLWRWYYARGQVEDWTDALERAKAILDVPQGDRAGLAYVLLRLSGARWLSGNYEAAKETSTQAMGIWRELGDEGGEAAAYMSRALVDIRVGEHESAIQDLGQALSRYARVGNDRGRAHALSNLAYLYEETADLESARDCLVEAVELLDQLGHKQGLAHSMENLACVLELLGDLDGAERGHDRASNVAVELGDLITQAYAVNGLGNVLRRRGDPVAALALHERARQLADEVTDPALRAQLYADRGNTNVAAGNLVDALYSYLAALDLTSSGHSSRIRAMAAKGAVATLQTLGREADAIELRRVINAAPIKPQTRNPMRLHDQSGGDDTEKTGSHPWID